MILVLPVAEGVTLAVIKLDSSSWKVETQPINQTQATKDSKLIVHPLKHKKI